MKAGVTAVLLVTALLLSVADVYAMAWGGGRGRGGDGTQGDSTKGNWHGSVPEPSALYLVGSGLALLGGASWYIRRRK